MRRLRGHRPSPGFVLAFIALCVAIGGTATALPGRDSVTKDDIREGAVGKSEIRKGAVGKAEARVDSIGQMEVIEDSLTGNQILESSLGTVPNATRFGGTRRVSIDVVDLGDGQSRQLLSTNIFTLTARCRLSEGSPPRDIADIFVTPRLDGGAMDGSDTNPVLRRSDLSTQRQLVQQNSAANATGFDAESDGVVVFPNGSGTEIVESGLWAGVNVLTRPNRCQFGGFVDLK